MSNERPMKVIRLNYWDDEASQKPRAHITMLAEPDEVRIGVDKTFIGVSEDRLSLSGGYPSKFNIQGLSTSMRYAGMLQDSPFPLSLIPSTVATPFPKQIVVPPFLNTLPEIAKLASLTSAFVV